MGHISQRCESRNRPGEEFQLLCLWVTSRRDVRVEIFYPNTEYRPKPRHISQRCESRNTSDKALFINEICHISQRCESRNRW